MFAFYNSYKSIEYKFSLTDKSDFDDARKKVESAKNDLDKAYNKMVDSKDSPKDPKSIKILYSTYLNELKTFNGKLNDLIVLAKKQKEKYNDLGSWSGLYGSVLGFGYGLYTKKENDIYSNAEHILNGVNVMFNGYGLYNKKGNVEEFNNYIKEYEQLYNEIKLEEKKIEERLKTND